MDWLEETKGFYLVMNNAHVHTTKGINAIVVEREYTRFYLPPYFPELNSIKNAWSIVRNKVK
jgi:transposase